MVSFIKTAQFKENAKKHGVKRMFQSSRNKLKSDLRAYAILLDVVAKSIARSQGKKIVQPEHIKAASEALKSFEKTS